MGPQVHNAPSYGGSTCANRSSGSFDGGNRSSDPSIKQDHESSIPLSARLPTTPTKGPPPEVPAPIASSSISSLDSSNVHDEGMTKIFIVINAICLFCQQRGHSLNIVRDDYNIHYQEPPVERLVVRKDLVEVNLVRRVVRESAQCRKTCSVVRLSSQKSKFGYGDNTSKLLREPQGGEMGLDDQRKTGLWLHFVA
ncbi:hypothetical protein Tco_0046228 [Tanacetum coccineum]